MAGGRRHRSAGACTRMQTTATGHDSNVYIMHSCMYVFPSYSSASPTGLSTTGTRLSGWIPSLRGRAIQVLVIMVVIIAVLVIRRAAKEAALRANSAIS
jgi:hypothetical protein